ncbi:hypothetical protein K469DRAFT_566148 [Zopfia rhizophila CBS 207.26]|uniref:peptidylprolyl isomerase n=1 Tax=Zopfia rhizophila CBS 207.26 TaxID=1314779 RepID=A0A6A6EDD4_9PEZI|nr:hypothetical protein K469DRAFT_566148 [Zopfia rhizophila CBS 207.26]
MEGTTRSRVFLDISIGTEPIGRLVIELFADKTPRTCENFRALCTSSNPALSYQRSIFYRIIPNEMVQGGDIARGDGTGGASIYGSDFEDENLGWCEMDTKGLVSMANRGKDTNNSQFFITLAPSPHMKNHTVFGRLISGEPVLDRMASVPIDNDGRPTIPIVISNCGDVLQLDSYLSPSQMPPEERGRRKRRRPSSSHRSPSPSRGHNRDSGSRHRQHHRKHRRRSSSSSISPRLPTRKDRRRSDADLDHNLRGRPRKRSRSRTRSPILETEEGQARHHRKRSPPPSRHRSESRLDGGSAVRRQRSLPNMYEKR